MAANSFIRSKRMPESLWVAAPITFTVCDVNTRGARRIAGVNLQCCGESPNLREHVFADTYDGYV
jgi:hypothetical protein